MKKILLVFAVFCVSALSSCGNEADDPQPIKEITSPAMDENDEILPKPTGGG